jgi:hypothetical protein
MSVCSSREEYGSVTGVTVTGRRFSSVGGGLITVMRALWCCWGGVEGYVGN